MLWRKSKNEVDELQRTVDEVLAAIENARKVMEQGAEDQQAVIEEMQQSRENRKKETNLNE